MSDHLKDIEETGEQLAVSRTTVFKLIRSGELKSIKIGKSRRVPASAIDEFIAARTSS